MKVGLKGFVFIAGLTVATSIYALSSPQDSWSVSAANPSQTFASPACSHYCKVTVANNGPGNVSLYIGPAVGCGPIGPGAQCSANEWSPTAGSPVSVHYAPPTPGALGSQGTISFQPFSK